MKARLSRILLVEDEEAHVELIRRAFESGSMPAELSAASTVLEAKARLADFVPDLLIADLLLPDGRGTELIRQADGRPHVPVVIMTAQGDEKAAVEVIKAGALDYVVKSEATLGDMPHIAQRALREWGHVVQRKRAEKRLRLLSSAVEQSSEGMAVTDLEGKLLFINDAFASMHGLKAGDLIGKHISVFHTTEQMPTVNAINRQIRETGQFSGELWHARSDGTVFPTLMRNSLLRLFDFY